MTDVVSFIERKNRRCLHLEGLTFDPSEAFAECKKCGAQVTLGFALEKVMQGEARAARMIARANLVSKEMAEKTKTKCQHCSKMTTIKSNVTESDIIQESLRVIK